MFKRSQIGRSMIEMLGVLAIIGVLSVGGLAAYSKAMRKITINETEEYINRIKMEFINRKIITGSAISATTRCDDFIDEDMPMGMDGCECRPHNNFPRIDIHFASNTTLLEIINHWNVPNVNNSVNMEERLPQKGVSIVIYQRASGNWWRELGNKYLSQYKQ